MAPKPADARTVQRGGTAVPPRRRRPATAAVAAIIPLRKGEPAGAAEGRFAWSWAETIGAGMPAGREEG